MAKNYTKPHDKDYEDKPEDYLFLTMAFSRVLTKFLAKGQGVLIDLKGDMVKIHPELTRVVIFNDGILMRVIDASERTDLEDGDMIQMFDEKSLSN